MFSSRRGFLSGSLALAGGLGAAEQGAPAPLRIGVVNVRTCFEKDKVARMAEFLEELGKLRDQLTREAGELQKNIAALADLMERLERGGERNGDLYVEKLRLRAHAEYDLKLLQEVARRKLRDRVGDLESRVYADLRRIVAQVARARSLDLVLRVDEPRLQMEDPEAPQKNASREVLFHQDALDVTPQVLARLNAEWAKAWPCAACKRKVTDEKCPDCGAKRP
jgi:Skp family chaperone for outer membrane proteins